MHNVHYVHVKEMCACVKYYIEALGDRAVCCNEGGRERERERERERYLLRYQIECGQ